MLAVSKYSIMSEPPERGHLFGLEALQTDHSHFPQTRWKEVSGLTFFSREFSSYASDAGGGRI
jgi:hypothetical protein